MIETTFDYAWVVGTVFLAIVALYWLIKLMAGEASVEEARSAMMGLVMGTVALVGVPFGLYLIVKNVF